MRQLICIFLICLFLPLAILALPAQAEAPRQPFTLGAGVGYSPDYEGSDDYEAMPVGYFSYETDNFIIRSSGPGVELDLFTACSFDFGPIVRYHGGRDDVEDDVVDRLDDVHATADIGAFIGAGFPVGRLTGDNGSKEVVTAKLTYLQDVLDNGHGGFQLSGSVGYKTRMNDSLFIIPSVQLTYASDDYNDSMFSISPAESASTGLSRFSAEGGMKDTSLSLLANQKLSQHWSATALVSYSHLLGDAADSPIVDDRGSSNQFFSGATLNYSF